MIDQSDQDATLADFNFNFLKQSRMAVCGIHRLVTVDSNKSKQQGFFRITSMKMHQNTKNDVFIWEWNQSKYGIGENFNSRTRPEQDQDNFENLEWKPKSDRSVLELGDPWAQAY